MTTNPRSMIVYAVIIMSFTAIFVRLFDIMVVKHEKFAKKAEDQRMAEEDIQVRRGLILDRMGRRMAVNIENSSVYCFKNRLKEDHEKLDQVASIIDMSRHEVDAKLDKAKNFFWLKRKVSQDVAQRLEGLKIPAIGVTPEAQRYYPMGAIASHVLGFVDIDNKGLAGVEGRYNSELIEKGGKFIVERDAKGNRFYSDNERETIGKNLIISIDMGLQYIVENELEEAIKKWKAEAGTVIMMDPHNGEILAMANSPTYDANHPGKADPALRRNRAITDLYEPGSTFKVVTATGVLEENLARPEEKIDCSAGTIEVGGKRIKDAHRHGVLSFLEVIQKSSNVGTIKLAQRLGKERLHKYMKLYGFGSKTGIDIPGEVNGMVKPVQKWSGVSIGAMPIGQEVGVTPLQVVTAYSMVANGGYRITPHIAKGIVSDKGKEVLGKKEKGERVLSDKTVKILVEALMMVTEKGGTATFSKVDGNKVAGKTGTAQLFDRRIRRYSSTDFVSSFVGFVPAEKPAFSLIVVIWKPRGQTYGGLVAAPVFKNIAEKSLSYLNVPREDFMTKNVLFVKNQSSSDESYHRENQQ